VDHIRLFPVRGDIRSTYRVHEQILPELRRANIPVNWTGITVRHTGYTDRALRVRKLDRDIKILREELADRPDDPFVLFNLGPDAIEWGNWRDALEHLRHGGDHEEARSHWRAVLYECPGDREALAELR
jgi:hypothetical protein